MTDPTVKQFMAQFTPEKQYYTSSYLHGIYLGWCGGEGVKPVQSRKFSRDVASLGNKPVRKYHKSRNTYGFNFPMEGI